MADTPGRIKDRIDDAADKTTRTAQAADGKVEPSTGGVADVVKGKMQDVASAALELVTRTKETAHARKLDQAQSEDRWRDDGGQG